MQAAVAERSGADHSADSSPLERVVGHTSKEGIIAEPMMRARRYADQGLRFIGIGSDATLLALAGRHAVARVRGPDAQHGEQRYPCPPR